MAKGRRKSNREAKKPKKSAAEKSSGAAISISIQAPGASYRRSRESWDWVINHDRRFWGGTDLRETIGLGPEQLSVLRR
jgi:hypothetical protein